MFSLTTAPAPSPLLRLPHCTELTPKSLSVLPCHARSRNTYTDTGTKTNVGAAVGGAIAGLFVILAIVAAFWFHKRHNRGRSHDNNSSGNDHPVGLSRAETPNEAMWRSTHDDSGLVRRGTFNLRHLPGVQLNEDSVDALRMSEPPPPQYVAPQTPKQHEEDDDDEEEQQGQPSTVSINLSRSISNATSDRRPDDTIVELPTVRR